jgi:ribose transport system substrate-binding protein
VRKQPHLLVAIAVLAIVSIAALAGCGGGSSSSSGSTAPGPSEEAGAKTEEAGSSAEEKPVKIAFFALALFNSYGVSMEKAAEAAAAENNAEIDVFNGEFNPSTQLNQIQDATTSGKYQAFVVAPVDGAAVAPVVNTALQEGITVTATYGPIGPDQETLKPQVEGLSSTVAESVVDEGAERGKMIVEACETVKSSTCTVALETGPTSASADDPRTEGVEAVLEQHPNIEIVWSQPLVEYSAEAGRTNGQNLAQSNPDVDVWATEADEALEGAMPIIESTGLKNAVLIGYGGSKWGIEQVRNGTFFSDLSSFPATETAKATELAIEAARGKTVPTEVPVKTISPLGAKFGAVVTKEALEQNPEFKGEY